MRLIYLTLCVTMVFCQGAYSQTKTIDKSVGLENQAIISGVHTLSVHVRDTVSHDSVYRFFLQKLRLPVYYTPLKYGQRKYAGIYAGNMVLEPCGPYENINYATDNFRAIFFGLNLEVGESLGSAEQELKRRGIQHQVNQGSIFIKDSLLCNENIFTALYEVRDKEKRDSLRILLENDGRDNPGIEYIKRLDIAYKEERNLQKWKEYLHPLDFGINNGCQINDSLQFLFTRGKINEVRSITFKVKSLKETEQYLRKNQFFITVSDSEIELNQTQSFGLEIYFTDEK